MIKSEWRNLLKNKMLLIVVVAIMLIPSIYAALFLASMWNPYESLEKLPVAVVNKDKTVTYNDQELSVGDDLVKRLKKKKELAFNFVDADTANRGLKNGTFYMVITIPKNFSENATTLMEEDPEKMVLKYDINPGTNYIASQLSKSEVKKIKDNVAKEVTKVYTESVFDQLMSIADDMDAAVETTDSMIEGEDELVNGNQGITDKLNLLSQSTLTFKSDAGELKNGIASYVSNVSNINSGARQVDSGISEMQGAADRGINKLAGGSKSLNKNVTDYTKGLKKIYTGAKSLVSGNKKLNNSIKTMTTATKNSRTRSSNLYKGLKSVSTSIGTSLSSANQTQIKSTATTIDSVGKKIALTEADETDATGITTGTTSITTQASAVSTETTTVLEQLNALDTSGMSSAQREALDNAKTAITNAQTASNTILTDMETMNPLINRAVAADVAVAGLKKQVVTTGGVNVLSNGATVMNSLMNSNLSVKQTLDSKWIPETKTLYSGINKTYSDLTKKKGIKSSIKSYTDAVATISNGAKQLNSKSGRLVNGTKEISSGVSGLNSSMDSGLGRLSSGAGQVVSGTTKMMDSNNKLSQDAEKVLTGAGEINDSIGEISDSSSELGNSIVEVQNSTTTLQGDLSDSSVEIRNNEASKDTIEMFIDPVETKEKKITKVETNGDAMAAYMMTVGLWIGCIVFCIMYPITRFYSELKGGARWWFSKATVLYPMVVAMAIGMVFVLYRVNGFRPVSLKKTFLVACATAVAFMSIVYFFHVLFGKIGSFMMLIALIIQISGSAGIFPVAISGRIVGKIHKYMPFTYAIEAFKSTICGGTSIRKELFVLGMLTVFFAVCTLVAFIYRTKRIRQNSPTLYEWLVKRGIA
ncbi:MAG: YhgE/Pip domain-containing protein [Lachnospiraceae bacterium]|nr:YhgE/Pip domain-containing protein [Lachnospiraceae bacterium]